MISRPAVKLDAVNSQAQVILFAVFGQFEVNRDRAAALLVGDVGFLRRAEGNIPATRAIGHVIDNINLGLLRGRQVEVGDGEFILPFAGTGDFKSRVARGEFSLDVFALPRLT